VPTDCLGAIYGFASGFGTKQKSAENGAIEAGFGGY